MKVIKTIIFLIAWVASSISALYLFGSVYADMPLSTLDYIMYTCTFILSMLWLWFNSVKV